VTGSIVFKFRGGEAMLRKVILDLMQAEDMVALEYSHTST
jgi:hypothetical protein